MGLRKLFGKRLRQIRESKGLTQEKLAELIDVQPGTISQIELGYRAPSFDIIDKLVEKLEVSHSDLFEFIEIQTNTRIAKNILKMTENFDKETLIIATQILEYFNDYINKHN